MPRPSDLYATLGAPGVYQSTPWTPSILPNVFLIPPAEDSQDVYCLFHSGSASPTSYDPFYGDPSFIRRDASSPTMANMAVLDQALSFIHHQAVASAGASVFGRRSVWEHGQHATMSPRNAGSRSPDSPPFGAAPSGTASMGFPNVRFLVEMESRFDSPEEQTIQSRPTSRRSSVFGERPFDHKTLPEGAPEEEEGGFTRPKSPQSITFRSRAATVLKAIGGAKVRRSESDARSEGGSDIDHHQTSLPPDQNANSKPHKRRTFAQLFGSNSGVDVSLPSPELAITPPQARHSPSPPPSTRLPKLTKRKSMTQILGFARSPTVATFETQDAPEQSDSTLQPSSPALSLLKRRSVTELFSLGRSASSSPTLAALSPTSDVDVDNVHMVEVDPRLAALRALEGSLASQLVHGIQSTNPSFRRSATSPSVAASHQRPEAQAPPVSSPPPDKQQGRKLFSLSRPFSILDLHRHFSSSPVSASRPQIQTTGSSPRSVTPSVSKPPSPMSETLDSSSSNPASTDSEPEFEDAAQAIAPRVGVHSPTAPCFTSDGTGVIGLSPTIQLVADGKGDVPQWVESLKSGHIEIESEEEGSPLDLATQLDSFSFDRLTFDPESFVSAAPA